MVLSYFFIFFFFEKQQFLFEKSYSQFKKKKKEIPLTIVKPEKRRVKNVFFIYESYFEFLL